MRVELGSDAAADLSSILEYGVEVFGLETGRDYFFSFDLAFALLIDHPLAGMARPEIDATIRSFKHRRHCIYYDVVEDLIMVQRILHHSMDVARHLKGR